MLTPCPSDAAGTCITPRLDAEAGPSPGCWHYHLAVLSLCPLLCPLTISPEFSLGPGQPRGSQGQLNSSGLVAVPVVLRSFPFIRTSKRGGPKDNPPMGPLEENLTRFADRSRLWVQAKVSPHAPLNSVSAANW